jgi:hypothetical protein
MQTWEEVIMVLMEERWGSRDTFRSELRKCLEEGIKVNSGFKIMVEGKKISRCGITIRKTCSNSRCKQENVSKIFLAMD